MLGELKLFTIREIKMVHTLKVVGYQQSPAVAQIYLDTFTVPAFEHKGLIKVTSNKISRASAPFPTTFRSRQNLQTGRWQQQVFTLIIQKKLNWQSDRAPSLFGVFRVSYLILIIPEKRYDFSDGQFGGVNGNINSGHALRKITSIWNRGAVIANGIENTPDN